MRSPRQRPAVAEPAECERLQGLPDGWTKWGSKTGKTGRSFQVDIKDGPRYRMIGNGAAVPHVEWIGRRLAEAMR